MNVLIYLYPDLLLGFFFIVFFIYSLVAKVIISVPSNTILKKFNLIDSFKNYDGLVLKKSLNTLFSNLKSMFSFSENVKELKETGSEKLFLWYSAILCYVGFLMYVYQLLYFFYATDLASDSYSFFYSSYTVDSFSIFFKAFILLLGFLFFIISYYSTSVWRFYGMEFGFLIFLILFSMLLLVSSTDFFLIFLSLELQSLSIVILTAFQVTQKRSIEAGLKYFILSSFFSGIYLFGISLIYLVMGSVNFLSVYELTFGGSLGSELKDQVFLFSIILVTATILFKLGLVPYHFWTPDVYQGANLLVTAFLAVISKIGLLVVAIRIYFTVFVNFFYSFEDLIYLISLSSIFLGAVMALFQTDLRRFLAYTSISNMGYVMLAISLGTYESLLYGLFYFVSYVFATLALFLAVLGFTRKEIISEDGSVVFDTNMHDFKFLVSIYDLEGLAKNNKFLAFLLIIILFNLLGVPPFYFFFSKFFLFECCLRYNLFLAIFILVLSSLVSAFYYLRIIRIIFLNRFTTTKLFVFFSKEIATIFYSLVFVTIVLSLSPSLFISLIDVFQYILTNFFFFK